MDKVYVSANDLETDANTLFKSAYEKAYTKGQEDAWEYARKIAKYWSNGRSTEIFDATSWQWIFLSNSIFEVVDQIDMYEAKFTHVDVDSDNLVCEADTTNNSTSIEDLKTSIDEIKEVLMRITYVARFNNSFEIDREDLAIIRNIVKRWRHE